MKPVEPRIQSDDLTVVHASPDAIGYIESVALNAGDQKNVLHIDTPFGSIDYEIPPHASVSLYPTNL